MSLGMSLGISQLVQRTVFVGLLLSSTSGACAETQAIDASTLVWNLVAADAYPEREAETTLARSYPINAYSQQPASQAVHLESAGSGFNKHQLTDGLSLIGWRLSNKLYFGRAKKDRAAVSFIWQTSLDQHVSISTQGLKFTRRLK